MRVGVIGINHKLADLKLREQLAKICSRKFSPECSIHLEQSFVLLSTCNRTELYFSSADLAETHNYILSILRSGVIDTFDQRLYSYFGEDAFLHLAKVTAGLDSAIVGETEIQGQIKLAYEKACQYGVLPYDLHFIFQKALKVGKKVRSELIMGRGVPDLEHAILSSGWNVFSNPADARILFVGASDINFKVIHFLRKKEVGNITLCNRTDGTAAAAAQRLQVAQLPWQQLEHWHTFDWIIFGTKASEYLIRSGPAIHNKKLIIDLCVPRNVDPLLGKEDKVTLLNIDQINRMLRSRKRQMLDLLYSAEQIVTDSTLRQSSIFRQKLRTRAAVAACL